MGKVAVGQKGAVQRVERPSLGSGRAVNKEAVVHSVLDEGAACLFVDVLQFGLHLLWGYSFCVVVATHEEGGTAEGACVVAVSSIGCFNTLLRPPFYA